MSLSRAIVVFTCLTVAGALSKPKSTSKHHVAADLPSTAQMLQQPTASLQSIGSRVEEFEDMLKKRATEHKKTIAQQKADYEQTLLQQVAENEDLSRGNRGIKREIETLNTNYTQLRAEATSLQETALHFKSRLDAMRSNISLATEFANQALTVGSSILDGSEVQVLKDLDAQDATRRKEEEHERSLQTIASARKVAMFQVETQAKTLSDGATAQQLLLTKLASSMEELQSKQMASEASLKVAFESELHALEATRDGLLAEQAKLKEQRADLQKLCDDLVVAITHLKKASTKMHSEESALKRFSERLSSRDAPSLQSA